MLPVMYAVASVLIVLTLLVVYADIVKPIQLPAERIRPGRRAVNPAKGILDVVTIQLGMPGLGPVGPPGAEAPPVLAPRRISRQIKVGSVAGRRRRPDLGPVDGHHADLRRQRDPAADRRS